MARINVEQSVLLDRRYQALARRLKMNRYEAIGRMIFIWNECQERELYELSEEAIGDVFPDKKGFALAMIEAELAEKTEGGKIRIRGTQGRIEWLSEHRRIGRESGKLGGRPKNPKGLDKITQKGSMSETPPPPTPPPTPPPAPPQKTTKNDQSRRPKSLEEVKEYAKERKGLVDPEHFWDKNESIGWKDKNGNPYHDWKAVFRTWEVFAKKNQKADYYRIGDNGNQAEIDYPEPVKAPDPPPCKLRDNGKCEFWKVTNKILCASNKCPTCEQREEL